ncbi:precorrin-6y C5,15-methyltransferase (decarboxylating) subunit CbiE [Actinokineospora enzanensis]|uniref:precorrin-6y C5,15-methyltransferase (decarboxylating) subunit CbiE n=1 Tax=Actinokineospora enzanensis TaxID=155975 RepID=UPI000374BD1E|nr:precorrin-6y C5,15-methyltransferase (decarboxylating) subunit CbiE [Actinokineospora enzanensis]
MSGEGEIGVTVVGIGADGWAGLAPPARAVVLGAEVVVGAGRQLGLLPDEVPGERVAWPSPLVPAIPGMLAEYAGREVCVLASGDPMFHGIGTTLSRFGPVRVLPHPSSVSLACARLGWAADDVEVVSAVGRPVERLHAVLHPGRRVLVLSENGTTPSAVVELLRARGFGSSVVTVLEELGGPGERVTGDLDGVAALDIAALNVVAVECVADPGARRLPRVPGLPDDVYEHDGQITKREIRAVTVSALAPEPGELLWDVGAGSGSVGIEWSRTHPACRAVAIESRDERADRVVRNARALGVPGLQVVRGAAPAALADLEQPDAVFVGGGVTAEGVLPACWSALRPGGRIVVNAVTLESEALVVRWQAAVGGSLTRLEVGRAAPIGGFTAWRPALPVTQWVAIRNERIGVGA